MAVAALFRIQVVVNVVIETVWFFIKDCYNKLMAELEESTKVVELSDDAQNDIQPSQEVPAEKTGVKVS